MAGTSLSGADDGRANDGGAHLRDGAPHGAALLRAICAADKPTVDERPLVRAVGAAHDALGPVPGTHGALVRTDGGGHVRPDARLVRGALVSAFRPAKLRPYDLHAYCTSVTRSLFSDAAPFGGPILRDAATKHGNAYDALAVIGTDLCDESTNVFAAAVL